jgi:hypothetical protein
MGRILDLIFDGLEIARKKREKTQTYLIISSSVSTLGTTIKSAPTKEPDYSQSFLDW